MGVSQREQAYEAAGPLAVAPEMIEALRVVDVAGAVRRSRRPAEDLARDTRFRDQLRRSLVQQARQSGDAASEAEINSAIELYLARPREYADPPWSFGLLAARLWICRGLIGAAVAIVIVALAVLWLASLVYAAIA